MGHDCVHCVVYVLFIQTVVLIPNTVPQVNCTTDPCLMNISYIALMKVDLFMRRICVDPLKSAKQLHVVLPS